VWKSLAGANMPRLTGVGRTTLELFGCATNMFASDQRYQACDLNESFFAGCEVLWVPVSASVEIEHRKNCQTLCIFLDAGDGPSLERGTRDSNDCD